MVEVVVHEPVNVRMDDGTTVVVPAGKSDQPPVVADHWFVKAHLVGTPKARMPVVEGVDGVMIDADEAGQKVQPLPVHRDPLAPPLRQEGPADWSKMNPRAVEAAKAAAETAETSSQEPVDGQAAIRQGDAGRAAAKAAKPA